MTTIHSRKLFLMLAASLGLTSAYALETEQFVYSVENGEARVTTTDENTWNILQQTAARGFIQIRNK